MPFGSGGSGVSGGWEVAWGRPVAKRGPACQTTWTCLPTRRLRLMIRRPLLVRIRARKPIFRARFRFEILRG